MNTAQDTLNRVQLIISAKSSGASDAASSWAQLPREETRERFTQALDHAAGEVFEMMVWALPMTLHCLGSSITPPWLDWRVIFAVSCASAPA